MAEAKTKPTTVDVAGFLSQVEPGARRSDGQSLCQLMGRVTGQEPRMWGPSIVGFGEYHYRYESGREGTSPQIGFSPRKPALVLYGMGIERHADRIGRLGKCTTGKGCLYINRLSDIDPQVLEALIRAAWAGRT